MSSLLAGASAPRTIEGKLRPPSLAAWAVDRPRLIIELDAVLHQGGSVFTMLSAPAGFGKTYLLSQWSAHLSSKGITVAWAGLTEDDRDPVALWSTILDSLILASSDERITESLMGLTPAASGAGHSAFVAAAFSAISRHPDAMALIIDNSHLLLGSASERELIGMAGLAPPNLSVVFATRIPLHVQSARISGQLVELTADSLSFTRAETTQMYTGRNMGHLDIDQLIEQAEGWPAALSIALLTAAHDVRAPDGVANWTDPDVLSDYLKREIWADLTLDQRAVLTTTGATTVTTAQLVETITEVKYAASTLRRLAMDRGLMVRDRSPADGRVWYRARTILVGFLRSRVADLGAVERSQLYAGAARWHNDHGDALEALALAQAAGDDLLAEEILRRHGYGIVAAGDARRLLETMPATGRASRPFTHLMMAYVAASCGARDRAHAYLARVPADELSASELLEREGFHYLVQLQLALVTIPPRTIATYGFLAEKLSHLPTQLRLAILLTRGIMESRIGDGARGRDDLGAALAVAENEGSLPHIALSLVGLAASAAMNCDFRESLVRSDHALALIAPSVETPAPAPVVVAHIVAGWASLELLTVPDAQRHATAALKGAVHTGDTSLQAQARHLYNEVFFDTESQKRRIVQEFVTEWPPEYLRGGPPVSTVASLHSGLHMAARLREPRWSERLLNSAQQLLGEGVEWQVAYALYLAQTGRVGAARVVLGPALEATTGRISALSAIAAWSLQAALDFTATNLFRSHAALYTALEIADRTGAFYEVGRGSPAIVHRILALGAGRFGPHDDVARFLLAQQRGEHPVGAEPLTSREHQILGELTSLRTVDEIAHDLLISVNTVKTHMRGIYRKLDVSSRRQAVTKAKQFGLL